jgi:amidohydrolase family protein
MRMPVFSKPSKKSPYLLVSCRSSLVLLISCSILTSAQPRPIVIDNVRVIDGTGTPPIEHARILISGDRIEQIGQATDVPAPDGAETIDLDGKTVIPGLIDLHFHIENDPKLALRQLSHGVTSFRDPGQWEEKFVELRRMIAADGLPGPRIFTAGPHIDGENPAYPGDAVVARDATEARMLAERNIQQGASALKIYFRLPFASAKAVIDVCRARHVPCTAHLELLTATDLFVAGLEGIEHITSLGIGLLPRTEAEAYRQAVLRDNEARRDGRYEMFAKLDLNGPEAQALYSVLAVRRPWIDPTLAVFERRPQSAEGRGRTTNRSKATKPDLATVMVQGFTQMKQLTRRAGVEGARIVMGGHSTVPFASRGEAPWRELELLVESGFSPLEAMTAATGTAAGFLYRGDRLGTLRPGLQADIAVLRDDPSKHISAVRTVERVMIAGRWIDVAKYKRY